MNLASLRLVVALVALMLAGVVLALVFFDRMAPPPPPPAPSPQARNLGQWQPANARGEPVALDFVDGAGAARSLAEWRGRVVLVNLWATWCAPCIEEMPALDRIAARLGGPVFDVVAIAVDRQGATVVRPFMEKLGLARLQLYLDPSNGVVRALGAPGLPVSVVLDREGREIGRVLGAAEWDGPAFERLLREAIGP